MENKRAKKLLSLLESSVEHCCREGKDLVGMQLSGGLDSSVVQAIGKFKRTYCVTFPECDNITAAKKASCGSWVIPVTFTKEQMIEEALPEVARATAGKGTWSQCCQWFMARAMAKDGCRIDMNGEGSDELFMGYARYRILYWLDKLYSDEHLSEYRGIVDLVLGDKDALAARMIGRTMSQDRAAKLSERMGCLCLVYRAAAVDRLEGLPPLIDSERKIAELFGLVHRWPYMSATVQDFATALPMSQLINGKESKVILRDVARHLGVHRDIIEEVTKKGLFVPTEWRDDGEPPYSRAWFDKLMADAWARVKPEIGE